MTSSLIARARRFSTSVCCIAVVCAVMAPTSQAAAAAPAEGLCTKAAAGTLDGDLAGKDAQVVVACDAQRASFVAANTTFTTTQAALRARVKAARAAAQAACEAPASEGDASTAAAERKGSGGPSATCRAARAKARAELKQVGVEMRAARRTQHAALKQARATFRAAIRSLVTPTA